MSHEDGSMPELTREVLLPPGVSGHLYVMRMPGRFGNFAGESSELAALGIDTALCLAPLEEIQQEAPEYAAAIQAGALPWQQRMLPVPDFGVPPDLDTALAHVRAAAEALKAGRRLLLHCGAGIGRSGTIGAGILMALGMTHNDAVQRMMTVGSYPESPGQEQFAASMAQALGASDAPADAASGSA